MLRLFLPCLLLVCSLHAQVSPPKVVVKGDGYFPVMIGLRDGSLLTVLRGGAAHVGKGGRLDLIASADGGKSWPRRWTVIDGPEDDRNPALGQLADGTIVLAYAVLSGYDDSGLKLKGRRTDWKFTGVYVIRSSDGGKTWTKPELAQATAQLKKNGAAISPYGKIVQLPDGTALMAVYYEVYDSPDITHFESYLFRSKDGGRTWGDPSLIRHEGNETALAVLPDGSLLAAVRTTREGFLSVTRSTDGGRTWSTPIDVTKNNEHPADLIVLKDGRIVMTFGERNPPRGARALISADGGKSWSPKDHIILAAGAPNVDCGYPSSWEVAPNRILTIYYQVDDLNNAPASASARTVEWTPPR